MQPVLHVDDQQIPVVQEVPQDIAQEAVDEIRHGTVPMDDIPLPVQ
jgi:hypothetical protein